MAETRPGADSRPALGMLAATALVVGNMIGSGLFLLPSTLASYGGAAFLGWGVSGVGALLLAMVFARLGMRYPRQGGPYAFARQAFGNGTAFAVAWSYWISTVCGNAAIAIAFAGYFTALVPGLSAPLLAVCAVWLCTLVNLGGVRGAGRVQVVLTVVKLLPLVAIVLVGVWSVHVSAWQPFNRSGQGLLGVTTATAALTLWSFCGVECATIPAGEVRDPARTIPRATLVGTAIAIIVTISACMIVVGLVPAATLAHAPAPFAAAAGRLWGSGAGFLFAATGAVSCLGALTGSVLIQGQLPLAVARDGLLPTVFARLDARGTPWVGLIVGSVLASVLVLANYQRSLVGLFTFAILLSTAAILVAYAVCSLAALRLREDRRGHALRALVATGALAFSLWALVGTGLESILWGAVLVLLGLPLYLFQRRRRLVRTS